MICLKVLITARVHEGFVRVLSFMCSFFLPYLDGRDTATYVALELVVFGSKLEIILTSGWK